MSEDRRALTYLELVLPKCLNTYGVAPCAAVLGFLGPNGSLSFDFTGASNNFIARGAGLTGAADAKSFTFSFWFVADALSGRILSTATAAGGGTERLRMLFTSNTLQIIGNLVPRKAPETAPAGSAAAGAAGLARNSL